MSAIGATIARPGEVASILDRAAVENNLEVLAEEERVPRRIDVEFRAGIQLNASPSPV